MTTYKVYALFSDGKRKLIGEYSSAKEAIDHMWRCSFATELETVFS